MVPAIERSPRSKSPARTAARPTLDRDAAVPGTAAALALKMQRTAGNSATAALLSRKNGKSKGKRRKKAKAKKESLAIDMALRGARLDSEPTKVEAFHEYGDTFREPDLDPDVDVYLEGRRAEDAPIVDRFRVVYNLLDSWILVLEEQRPDLLEEAEKKFTLSRRHTITAEVKAQTKVYKEQFRDMSNLDVFLDEQDFIEFVDDRIATLQSIITTLSQWVASKNAGIDPKTVSAAGTEIWRARWHQRIAMVNTLIDRLWPTAEKELERWIDKQTTIKNKLPIRKLEYIGSLAKGYKGPPKQHVRFNPEDFDIDANLTAPSLAEYALRHDKLKPDRGRIFGRHTTIKPPIAFADRMQAEIKRIEGIQDDPHDLFDVAPLAGETLEQIAERQGYEASVQHRERTILTPPG